MSVRFEIDAEELKLLQKKFKRIPDQVEKRVNRILHSFGIKTIEDRILLRIPVSQSPAKKRHASNSKSLRSATFNLGFETKPKKTYNYLVFPDKGLGTSIGRAPDEFMTEGMNDGTPRILQEINDQLDQLIEEEF
ncbi:hypothetical protein [Guptibacillus hwajinpoensis]|uniref:HK97 gp10 family phage protein n=1 Tax=Guptibacillus hwajinpoensis TaxID=208199 RepID=A0A0J6CZX3_9BACL|nr:hypothetical protein [Alkalihalobacillus macyae]KMM38598.1 hypothetical protein AB986_04785 [Alkalihalobacillus macyae]